MREKNVLRGHQWLVGLCLTLLLSGIAFKSWAQARQPGVLTQGCAVHWQAASVLSSNNSLDGFTQTVSPGAGEPGYLQIQHWNWDGAVNWRIPLSTDYTIRGATLTVAMSKPGGAWVYTSNQGLVDFMTARPVFTSPKVYVWGGLLSRLTMGTVPGLFSWVTWRLVPALFLPFVRRWTPT